jgi:ATP synthase protein I
MAKKKGINAKGMVGKWSFLIGVLLAVIFGLFAAGAWLPWLLVVLGLVIGLLNIEGSEVSAFLTAGTVLVLMGYFGGQSLSAVAYLGPIFNNLLVLFVPATIIVALKQVFVLGRD